MTSTKSNCEFVVEIRTDPLPHKEYRIFEDGKLIKSFNELSDDYAYTNAMSLHTNLKKVDR
jgi:hypothetical protein